MSPALTGGFFTVEPKGSFRPIHPLRPGRGSFPPNQGNSPIPDQGTGAGNKERTWLVGRLRLDRGLVPGTRWGRESLQLQFL